MSNENEVHDDRQTLSAIVREVGIEPGPELPCSYLPGRPSRLVAFRAGRLPAGVYHSLMDLNFRRSGDVFYRPACSGCRECVALRVPVATFRPNRAQRRCWARNRDLTVEVGRLAPTPEKHALFVRYLEARHDRQMSGEWDSFRDFLYTSPIGTREVTYRLAGRLVGVGIFDVEPRAVSTVYCFFDPDLSARSVGTFNILWTIDHCCAQGTPYVYLGYYLRDCRRMNYKINFTPCELLDEQGRWQPFPTPGAIIQ